MRLKEYDMNKLIGLGGLGAALLLQACVGGNDAPGSFVAPPASPPPPLPPKPPQTTIPVDAGGLWQATGQQVPGLGGADAIAMVAEDGRFRIVALGSDATLESYFAIRKAPFEGNGHFYMTYMKDGSRTPYDFAINMWGTVTERQSLTVSWTSAWDSEGSLTFTYDPELYEVPSSLSELEGTWAGFDDDSVPWITLTIDADGQFAGDVVSGCNPTGRFAVIDERFNLYDVQDVVFACAADSAYSGFAYLFGDNVSGPGLFVSINNGTEALRLEVLKD